MGHALIHLRRVVMDMDMRLVMRLLISSIGLLRCLRFVIFSFLPQYEPQKWLTKNQGLDTYTVLANAGIKPSTTATYTSAEIQTALSAITGSDVVLGCRRGQLNQAWYSFNVKGSLQTGQFVATAPAGKGGRGTCPTKGIKYLPKSS